MLDHLSDKDTVHAFKLGKIVRSVSALGIQTLHAAVINIRLVNVNTHGIYAVILHEREKLSASAADIDNVLFVTEIRDIRLLRLLYAVYRAAEVILKIKIIYVLIVRTA